VSKRIIFRLAPRSFLAFSPFPLSQIDFSYVTFGYYSTPSEVCEGSFTVALETEDSSSLLVFSTGGGYLPMYFLFVLPFSFQYA
jgi:hypothetical protein